MPESMEESEQNEDLRQSTAQQASQSKDQVAAAKLLKKRLASEQKFWSRFVSGEEKSLQLSRQEADVLGDPEIYMAPLIYRGDARKDVGYWILTIAQSIPTKPAVTEAVRAIAKYKGYTAAIIGSNLALTAGSSSDEFAELRREALVDGIEASPDALNYKAKGQQLIDKFMEKCKLFQTKPVVEFVESQRDSDSKGTAAAFAITLVDSFNDGRITEAFDVAKRVKLNNLGLVPWDYLVGAIDKGLAPIIKSPNTLIIAAAMVKFSKEAGKNLTPEELLPFLGTHYGLKEPISGRQISMLLYAENVAGVIDAANREPRSFVSEYSVSVEPVEKRYARRSQHIRAALIAVVGSKDKAKEAEAREIVSDIVGARRLDAARTEFRTRYKQVLPEILKELPDYRNAAKQLMRAIVRSRITESREAAGQADGNNGQSAIAEVFSKMSFAINGRFIIDLHKVRAFETKNPFEYDFDVQEACVYLPNSEHIINYANNSKCVLVKYEIVANNNLTQELGSAICYLDKGKFLVDSVEGHTAFADRDILQVVYTDLIERARRYGSDMLLFGQKGANETPKAFVSFLRTQKLPEVRVDLDLPKDKNELYLETKKGSLAFALRLEPRVGVPEGAIVPVLRTDQQKTLAVAVN
jgi:hypothetical protein